MNDKLPILKKLNKATIILCSIFVAFIILFLIAVIVYAATVTYAGAYFMVVMSYIMLIFGPITGTLSLATAIVTICFSNSFGPQYQSKLLTCGILEIFFILIPNCVIQKTLKQIENSSNPNYNYPTNNYNNPQPNSSNYYMQEATNNQYQNMANNYPVYNQPANMNNTNNSNSDDVFAKIQKMHDLKEKGLITEQEFQDFKKSTLGI